MTHDVNLHDLGEHCKNLGAVLQAHAVAGASPSTLPPWVMALVQALGPIVLQLLQQLINPTPGPAPTPTDTPVA